MSTHPPHRDRDSAAVAPGPADDARPTSGPRPASGPDPVTDPDAAFEAAIEDAARAGADPVRPTATVPDPAVAERLNAEMVSGTAPAGLVAANPFGLPGMPVNRANAFYFGFVATTGALVAYWLLHLLPQLSSVLTLVVVALFLALGLEPLVGWLEERGMRRGLAVGAVFIGVIALFAGFMSAVVPAVITQATELTSNAPALVESFQNAEWVKRLDAEYGILENLTTQLQQRLANGETVMQLFGGVYGAGAKVVSGAFSTFTVLVLTLYFTASLRSMREAAYRLVPASRRPRVKLLADEILRRIGGYIAGQVGVASINGFCTYVLLLILDFPYALVLAITVALFGLIPLVGATIGAVIVVIVALFQGWQTALIVTVYYLIYQQVENYVIAPRIMSRTVSVPGAVAVIAALAGGTLLGVVGALIAIPIAAGGLLLVQEVLIPRQTRH